MAMWMTTLKFVGTALLGVVLVGAGFAAQPIAFRADPNAAEATSPDQKLRAVADGSKYSVFDVATGKILFKTSVHKDTVTALAFSPNGKTIASGSADKTIRLCDVATGKLL